MKAQIKQIFSPDIPDLVVYKPEDEEIFCFLLQVIIGPENKDGGESFDMTVCTPKWLLSQHEKDAIIFGRHYIFVFEYNYERIINKLKRYVDKLNEETWDQLADKIGRIGKWEFEDYQL